MTGEDEERQPLVEEELQQPGMELPIDTAFNVDGEELVIKQEPPEMIPPELMEVDEPPGFDEPNDEAIDEEMAQVFPEEVSDFILQRAVSPPTYVDPDEERIEKLMLFYKDKYQLKDVTVALESCDKIWETLQLIKNLQGSSNEEDDLSNFDSPKNSLTSQSKLPGPLIPYQPMLGNNNKALPDFRFSVKSKKKLYHCITCGKEFLDSQQLRTHAINDHGVYTNPKRIYKQRGDLSKSNPVNPDVNKNKLNEKVETENAAPLVPVVRKPVEPVYSSQLQQTENSEHSFNDNLKAEESQVKPSNVKEKVKCVLCKRVCTDIVYHMKGYHKVGCISSIIAQCEKIIENNTPIQTLKIDNNAPMDTSVEASNVVTAGSNQVDINETLTTAVKKRKRLNHPRWTLQKKKFRLSNAVFKISTNGPYKCNVCLGLYKSTKSFSYHKRLHRIRGETPDNFDPSKCRFLNSPLRTAKTSETPEEIPHTFVKAQKESTKHQTTITTYITVQKESIKSSIQNEESMNSQDYNAEENDGNERTSCECGRSFRNYHTMYLHKVKCKGIYTKLDNDKSHSTNDTDSGIGISIKIKKNKNDSYEVVPTNTPIDENLKDSRSCKDSDASSNDSGVVSVDDNNQKIDSSELSKYSKRHSILRIQVAEDDEEVDIEDGDSVHSNSNEECKTDPFVNQLFNGSETSSKSVENKSQQNPVRTMRSVTRRNNIIPSLTNLCKQVLAKSKEQQEQMSTYKCMTCSTYFKNKTELMEHGVTMKHNVKSHCPCGKKFKNLKYFNIHVRRYHPLLLKCSYCNTNFDRIEKYTEHKCEVTEGKTFIEPILQTQCTECNELVDIGEPFDKHMKTHITDEVNLYQCFKCELRFDNSHQRRAHFSKEHGFSFCRICGKLLHIDYLSKHEAYHDGLGYPCHLCKKAFTQKILLKKHVQNTHDPLVNEIIKCIVCSMSMKLRYLKKHMSFHLHTEICRKCNKCYRSDEHKSLENHIAEDHPNDYPTLKCDTCNMPFLSDKMYEEHCKDGSCKSDVKDAMTLVQNATTN